MRITGLTDVAIGLEAGGVSIGESCTTTIIFDTKFSQTPVITLNPGPPESGDSSDVSVYVDDVTQISGQWQAVIRSTAPNVSVNYQAMGITPGSD